MVIAYAGTNRSDPDDIATDVQSIGHGRDELKKRGSSPTGPTVDSQFSTAQDFAQDVAKDYPDATITTTGHSLGESVAMYDEFICLIT
ncbi:hypothetical protein [Streptococcus macacae]|nr:hypothetical protein [Streptococcus macacae]